MKSSIAKLTNSPVKQEKTYQQAQADSTASYNMQLEKNKILQSYNSEMIAANPDNYKTHSRQLPQTQVDMAIDLAKSNAEKLKKEYKSISDKQKDLGVYLRDESFLMGQDVIDNENIEIGDDGYYYSTSGEMDQHTTTFEYNPQHEDDDPLNWTASAGEGVKTYRPHSKTDDLRPKSTRVQQQKIQTMKSKNLEFIPTEKQDFKPKKALPIELTKSDYFTITSKHHHSGDKYILKDSAGREVDRVTKKEYKEKYGDVLQRGTKKYGKENLERRLYIKK